MTVAIEQGIWNGILHSIKRKLNGETFDTWFDAIQCEAIDKPHRVIQLRAPNQVVKDWVDINYTNLLDQSLSEVSLAGYSVQWSIGDSHSEAGPVADSSSYQQSQQKVNAVSNTPAQGDPATRSVP